MATRPTECRLDKGPGFDSQRRPKGTCSHDSAHFRQAYRDQRRLSHACRGPGRRRRRQGHFDGGAWPRRARARWRRLPGRLRAALDSGADLQSEGAATRSTRTFEQAADRIEKQRRAATSGGSRSIIDELRRAGRGRVVCRLAATPEADEELASDYSLMVIAEEEVAAHAVGLRRGDGDGPRRCAGRRLPPCRPWRRQHRSVAAATAILGGSTSPRPGKDLVSPVIPHRLIALPGALRSARREAGRPCVFRPRV